MIDIENIVYNTLATVLKADFTGIYTASEQVKAPASFPAVIIEERDNSIDLRGMDGQTAENHARLMYEINVYSNKKSGKKAECKKIFNKIDEEMLSMGFVRITRQPITNLEDSTVYRIVGRYSAIVSSSNVIYRG